MNLSALVPLLLLLIAAMVMDFRTAHAEDLPTFTADEIARVATLGPWPPEFKPDPANRVSGKPPAIELGRRMFSDARMSPVGYIGCVTCHQPDRAFTDLRARAHGLADLPRNTPTLANLRLQRWYGWAGASDSLWMASIRPMLDARELDSSPAFVKRVFERDPELAACYRKVFGEAPRATRRTVVNVGKALAAFEETMVTARTPFDEFRNTLLALKATQATSYPASARRGLKIFIGAGGCIECHAGPNFSDGGFHRIVAGNIDNDEGRFEAVRIRNASAFNLHSQYNDDRSRGDAHSRSRGDVRSISRLASSPALLGQFRTPSLRNVAVTAPYMHDGRTDRLRDAIAHPLPSAPRSVLSVSQTVDLDAFLQTLTDRHGERRPWPPTPVSPCP